MGIVLDIVYFFLDIVRFFGHYPILLNNDQLFVKHYLTMFRNVRQCLTMFNLLFLLNNFVIYTYKIL